MHSVEFYRITRKQKESGSKMLSLVGVKPKASDVNALHGTAWANPLFAESLTLDTWYLDLEF